MKLSTETLMSITKQIEETDLEDGWTNDQNLEVKQGTFTILVTYRVLGELRNITIIKKCFITTSRICRIPTLLMRKSQI